MCRNAALTRARCDWCFAGLKEDGGAQPSGALLDNSLPPADFEVRRRL